MKKGNFILLLWECENFIYEQISEKAGKQFTKIIHKYINKKDKTIKEIKNIFISLTKSSIQTDRHTEIIEMFDNYISI